MKRTISDNVKKYIDTKLEVRYKFLCLSLQLFFWCFKYIVSTFSECVTVHLAFKIHITNIFYKKVQNIYYHRNLKIRKFKGDYLCI